MLRSGVFRGIQGHRPQGLPPLPLPEPEQVQPRQALVQKEQPPFDAVGQDRGDVGRYVPEIFRLKGLKGALEPEHVAERGEIQMLTARIGKDVFKTGHERAFRVKELIVGQAVGVGELGENFTLVLVHGSLNGVESTRDRGRRQADPGRGGCRGGRMRFQDACTLAFCRLGIAGLAPRAPGTWGTALACLIAPVCFLPLGPGWRVLVLLVLFVAGGVAAGRAETLLGRKDPGEVVIDELVGVWLVLLPFAHPDFRLILAAFVCFRIFDIVKPWPVRASETWLPGGFGVMIDDVLAGLWALVCVAVLHGIGVV